MVGSSSVNTVLYPDIVLQRKKGLEIRALSLGRQCFPPVLFPKSGEGQVNGAFSLQALEKRNSFGFSFRVMIENFMGIKTRARIVSALPRVETCHICLVGPELPL